MNTGEGKKPLHDKRHVARMLAVQYLYTAASNNKFKTEFFETESLLNELQERRFNRKLYQEIIEGVLANHEELDKVITDNAPEWPLSELKPVNLAILRIAIWEIKFKKGSPFKVVINEAIELTKELSDEGSAKFINGVLGKITQE